jgi:2'-5' RNA ligase
LADRNEHLVVVLIEQPTMINFEFWPLHITLVPWFPGYDEYKLDNILNNIAQRHKSFTVKAGDVEQWGKKEKFEVQKVGDPGNLHKLHWDVFNQLENNGFSIHQKDYLGEKYTPHLTLRNRYQRSFAFEAGTELKISNFTLIKQIRLKKTGTMIKSVAKEYKLNG